MMGKTTAGQLDALLQHLDAQRNKALEMLAGHNRMLAAWLQSGEMSAKQVDMPRAAPETIEPPAPAVAPAAPATPCTGNVVSLFEYSSPDPGAEAAPSAVVSDWLVFDENDADALAEWGTEIDALLETYGADDALAINRKQMAGTIFFTAARNALFYCKSHSGVLFVVCYAGTDENYRASLRELGNYADIEGLQVNLMAQENRVDDLKACGYSTTPMGIWQRIEPLSGFTLQGSKMRRLRYLVNKYENSGAVRLQEYEPGTTPDVDASICRVIDQWCELKEQTPSFVPAVREQVSKGGFGKDHRFFLTWRDELLDNVIVFSRDNFNDGYLMDLEFYAKDMPLGSTEFALSQIIGIFQTESRRLVSLGLTMGTGLFEHENGSADVHALFESLRKADYLNGDANAQYKNKYRPASTTMYLARPRGSGKSKLNDLMLLLGTG
jgi:hypothetical protein